MTGDQMGVKLDTIEGAPFGGSQGASRAVSAEAPADETAPVRLDDSCGMGPIRRRGARRANLCGSNREWRR